MAMFIIPNAGGACGPGWRVTYAGLSGPIPNDDYVYIEAQTFGGHLGVIRGTAITHGALSGTVTLGVDEVSLPPYVSQVTPANGDTILVFFEQLHANGTVVTSNTDTWTWDATRGLWGLLVGPKGTNADVSAILAAVRSIRTTGGQR